MKLFLIIFFFFTFFPCFSQEKAIKVEIKSLTSKGNFYYWKWENQFKLVTEGVAKKDVIISVTHGTLTAINDSIYSIVVSADSSKIGFTFSTKLKGKTILIDSKRRTVKVAKAIGLAFEGKLISKGVKFAKTELQIGKRFTIVFDHDLYKGSLPLSDLEAICLNGGGNMTAMGTTIFEGLKTKVFDGAGPGHPVSIDGCCRNGFGLKVCASGIMQIK